MALSLAALPAQTEPSTWADLVKARRQADTQDKSILLVFTAKEDDAASTRIQRQLLSNPGFRESIAESLIPLRIELSTSGSGGARHAGPLATLIDDLGMVMVPSLHLLDAQLRPFGHIQYRGQDFDVCIREIRSLLQRLERRNRYLREAEDLEGSARARRMDLALLCLGDQVRMIRYLPIIREIYDLDPDGKLGIKERYAMRLDWEELSSEIPAMLHRGVWAEVTRKVDAFCRRHDKCLSGRRQQQALYWKATAIMQEKGLKSAAPTLAAACKAAPDTGLGQRIKRMLDSLAAPGKLPMPGPIGRW
ncbi:MAG: hypothetical protein ACYTG5_19640 [Planctomycetota bacterium]|jgi:hypothetical protein